MNNRLTIMYRGDISKERVRELIRADDATIISWDDPFAERDVLVQRCMELEAERADLLTHSAISADSKLIAAAPELLEALQRVLPQYEALLRDCGLASLDTTDHARAAITKAKGESTC